MRYVGEKYINHKFKVYQNKYIKLILIYIFLIMSSIQQQEETYEYCAEIDFEYLKKMNLLDKKEFKYIEEYLPFEDIPVIDFEWEGIDCGNGYEYNVKYRFTLENEKKKLEKTFSGVIERINTSSYLAYIFMELGEYYENQQEENEEESDSECILSQEAIDALRKYVK
mgnify:CR=1 FL=1